MKNCPEISEPKALLFDWDNTLVDNWVCIQAALNATFTEFGMEEWTLAETKQRVAASLRESFPVMFGDRWKDARDVFYDAFAREHLARLTPMPGAHDMLRRMSKAGLVLGVVSNKRGDYLRREVDHLDWNDYFANIIGANDAKRDKPDPAPVALALAGTGVAPGPDVWFVGDSSTDILCALNTGCTPVLITNGSSQIDTSEEPANLIRIGKCADLTSHLWE